MNLSFGSRYGTHKLTSIIFNVIFIYTYIFHYFIQKAREYFFEVKKVFRKISIPDHWKVSSA